MCRVQWCLIFNCGVRKNTLSRDEILSTNSISDFIFEDFSEGNFPELIETSQLSAVLIQISDYIEQAQLEYPDVRSQIEETYVLRESLKASEAFVLKSIEDLRGDKTLEILSSENNVEVETHLLKNCGHNIPIEASSIALQYIKKNFYG